MTHDRDAEKAIQKDTFMGIRRVTGIEKVETEINPNETTNNDVKVTINTNKKVQPVKGWSISSDGKTLIKTYTQNTTESIVIKDYEGNEIEKIINITNIVK